MVKKLTLGRFKLIKAKISPGNTKTGAIPAVSLLPRVSCQPGVPCMNDCYDWKSCKLYKRTLAARTYNWDLWCSQPGRYFNDIAAYLEYKTPRFFRFHIGGDIPDENYLKRMCEVTAQSESTNFLCFTKNHELVNDCSGIVPPNLEIVFSMWPGWGNESFEQRKAWMQDGTENRVPKDAIMCAGDCETCGMCWLLSKLGRDVVFSKH